MSAREEILGRVRAALAEVTPEARAATVPTPPRVRERPHAEVVDLFAERVADYRAVVERCGTAELTERLADALGEAVRVVVPPGLGLDLPGALEVLVDGEPSVLTAGELDTVDAVVTAARVGVAETGTIVLDHTDDQGRRALSLVPDLHVCVVRESQVVADVPDALALLEPARPHTWISGPSATSDIELSRVEGVHGPRTLHVLVVAGS